MNTSVEFFARQFERQIADHDYALNPFEQRVLPQLRGDVLDLGCGLGNLALAAAAAGHAVTAIDACDKAIDNLARRAAASSLGLQVIATDIADWQPTRCYGSVVSIGLLMFFDCERAAAVLAAMQRAVEPGGVCAVNVLIEGTTYLQMFDAQHHCLFAPDQLRTAFADWQLVDHWIADFAAGNGQRKRFATAIARKR